MTPFSEMAKILKVDVPFGHSGDWRIENFDVDEEGANRHNLYEAMHGSCRVIDPGHYTKLTCQNATVMSDTPSEISDHLPAIQMAGGHVLIAGLGLGVVVQGCLMDGIDRYAKTRVEKVTVVEKSEDVIKLVANHYERRFKERLEIVHDDIFTWKPPKGERYDMCWLDIWPNICTDNLDDMRKLKARFSRRSQWLGCWAEADCRRLRRRGW